MPDGGVVMMSRQGYMRGEGQTGLVDAVGICKRSRLPARDVRTPDGCWQLFMAG